MISKDEAKIRLKKAGYNVSVDGSLLTILIEPGKSIKNTVKEVKEFFLKIDYNMSFAVKQSSSAGVNDNDTSENSDDEEVIINNENIDTKEDSSEEYFDEEDDVKDIDDKLKLDEFDTDMILNDSSVQFSLEDFGMM